MTYFSDRESGEAQPVHVEVTPGAWKGLVALIQSRIDDGSFGKRFPEICPDGSVVCGANANRFYAALRAEIPALGEGWHYEDAPAAAVVMDLVEFCWASIGKPERLDYHSYHKHHHLRFDVETGQADFVADVNTIFRRNGIAYTLTDTGNVERRLPVELAAPLQSASFTTGDATLDSLLNVARKKFLDPDEVVRRESLGHLWDAWERLKTLGNVEKKVGIKSLLDRTAGEKPAFRQRLEQEAIALTDIGNVLHIRHSETTQEEVTDRAQVDYLFLRLYGFIRLILSRTGGLQTPPPYA